MRKLRQLVATGVVFSFCLGLAGSANAAPVWFQFYRTAAPDELRYGDQAGSTLTFGRPEATTVTLGAFRPGTRFDPDNPPAERLVHNTFASGGLGVGVPQNPPFSEEHRISASVQSGESLFLSFNHEVRLLGAVIFGPLRGYIGLPATQGERRVSVLRLGAPDTEAGHVDPLGESYAGLLPPNLDFGMAPAPGPDGTRLPVVPVEVVGSPRGTQFSLQGPITKEGDSEFAWFLGGVLVDVQPIPEPSTALLMAAGLFAMGFAGKRRP